MKKKRTLKLLLLFILAGLLCWGLFHDMDKLQDQKALHQWTSSLSEDDIFVAEASLRQNQTIEQLSLSPEQLQELLSILNQVPLQSITDRSDNSGDSQHYICLSLYLKNDDTDAANIYNNQYLLLYYYDTHAICLNTTRENAALYGNRNWRIEDPSLIAFFSELFP